VLIVTGSVFACFVSGLGVCEYMLR
jgi:hypothetical protein